MATASLCSVCNLKVRPFERADAPLDPGQALHALCWKCQTCNVLLDGKSAAKLEKPDGSAPVWYCRAHYNKAFKEATGSLPRSQQSTPPSSPMKRSDSGTPPLSSSRASPLSAPLPVGRDSARQEMTPEPSPPTAPAASKAPESPSKPDLVVDSLPPPAAPVAMPAEEQKPAADPEPDPPSASSANEPPVSEERSSPLERLPATTLQDVPQAEPRLDSVSGVSGSNVGPASTKEPEPVSKDEPEPAAKEESKLPSNDEPKTASKEESKPAFQEEPPSQEEPKEEARALESAPEPVVKQPTGEPKASLPSSALFRSDSPPPAKDEVYVPKVGGRGLANTALSYAEDRATASTNVQKKDDKRAAPVKKDVQPKAANPAAAKMDAPKAVPPKSNEKKVELKDDGGKAPPAQPKAEEEVAKKKPEEDPKAPVTKPMDQSKTAPTKAPEGKAPVSGKDASPADPARPVFKTRKERETWEAHQAFLERQRELEATRAKLAAKPVKSRAQIKRQAEVEATRKRLEELGVTWRSWEEPDAKLSALKSAAFGDVVAAASFSLKVDDQIPFDKEKQEIEKKKKDAEKAVVSEIYTKPIDVLLDEITSKHIAEREREEKRRDEEEWRQIEKEREIAEMGARVHPFKRFTEGGGESSRSNGQHELDEGPEDMEDGGPEAGEVLDLYGGDSDDGGEKRRKRKSKKGGATVGETTATNSSRKPAPAASVTKGPSTEPQQAAASAAAATQPPKKKGLLGVLKGLGKKKS
ncbi:hypothetical protein DFJ74DRAFT_773505 [Hyaloraphidium curvatum]|nr:hypothetical protein DFJ74DRAFT_773505 [Hyaloraphidium curvatum]